MGIPVEISTNFSFNRKNDKKRNKRLKEICIELAQNDSIMAMTHLAMSYEYGEHGTPSKTTQVQFDHTVKEITRLTQELRSLY